jgi:hypothetical protein
VSRDTAFIYRALLNEKLSHKRTFACERIVMAHDRFLVPLLPRASSSSSDEQSPSIESIRAGIPKRAFTAAACELCRQRKVRVSGCERQVNESG